MTQEEKLNEQLLKWVGFEPAPGCTTGCHVVAPAPSYKVIPTPNFTDPDIGIAYCFKWLVPKALEALGYKHWYMMLIEWITNYTNYTGIVTINPALTLCRLVQKYLGLPVDIKPTVNPILRSKVGLTSKESDVLVLMVLGYSTQEIGEALNIKPGTAKNHASSVISKLGVNSRGKAVAVSLKQGIVSWSENGQAG